MASPAWLRQRHSAEALRVDEPGLRGEGDALIVSRSGVAATVFVADCVPVLIAAGESVAAVHAGWRGLACGVLASAMRELKCAGANDPATAEAWIGPAIGPCCYEVGEDVASQVESASGAEVVIRRPDRKPHLDLVLAASRQLADLGVRRISSSGCCVRCDSDWWSYRRDGAGAGRNYAFIWRARSLRPRQSPSDAVRRELRLRVLRVGSIPTERRKARSRPLIRNTGGGSGRLVEELLSASLSSSLLLLQSRKRLSV